MQAGCLGLIFTAVIAAAVFAVSKKKKLNMR